MNTIWILLAIIKEYVWFSIWKLKFFYFLIILISVVGVYFLKDFYLEMINFYINYFYYIEIIFLLLFFIIPIIFFFRKYILNWDIQFSLLNREKMFEDIEKLDFKENFKAWYINVLLYIYINHFIFIWIIGLLYLLWEKSWILSWLNYELNFYLLIFFFNILYFFILMWILLFFNIFFQKDSE